MGTIIELMESSEKRKELWQWDSGRKVRIIPEEGTTVDEVHFGNVFSGNALVVEPKVDTETGDIVANIPNILLCQFYSINVYTVMLILGGKITTERKTFNVEAREKPSDYVYTETEIKNYDALEERVKKLEESIKDEEKKYSVQYVKQVLTEEEKNQARKNIDSASQKDIEQIKDTKAEKSYVVEVFEELKKLILDGNTVGAIAILDKAILDLSVLA